MPLQQHPFVIFVHFVAIHPNDLNSYLLKNNQFWTLQPGNRGFGRAKGKSNRQAKAADSTQGSIIFEIDNKDLQIARGSKIIEPFDTGDVHSLAVGCKTNTCHTFTDKNLGGLLPCLCINDHNTAPKRGHGIAQRIKAQKEAAERGDKARAIGGKRDIADFNAQIIGPDRV